MLAFVGVALQHSCCSFVFFPLLIEVFPSALVSNTDLFILIDLWLWYTGCLYLCIHIAIKMMLCDTFDKLSRYINIVISSIISKRRFVTFENNWRTYDKKHFFYTYYHTVYPWKLGLPSCCMCMKSVDMSHYQFGNNFCELK